MCGNCRRQDARHQCWPANAVAAGAAVVVGPTVVAGGGGLAPPFQGTFSSPCLLSSFSPSPILSPLIFPSNIFSFFNLVVNRYTIMMLKIPNVVLVGVAAASALPAVPCADDDSAASVPAGLPFADDDASIFPAFGLAAPPPDPAALAAQRPVTPPFPATTPRPGHGHFDENGYYHFEYPDPMECALMPIPPKVGQLPLSSR
jgi:hypothetical protein